MKADNKWMPNYEVNEKLQLQKNPRQPPTSLQSHFSGSLPFTSQCTCAPVDLSGKKNIFLILLGDDPNSSKTELHSNSNKTNAPQ
jgi:hypothetical protein